MTETKVNCISYVHFALGLRKREKYIDPGWPVSRYRDFEKVDNLINCEAVGIVYGKNIIGRGKNVVVHMAQWDQTEFGFVWQRKYYNTKIERVSFSEMLVDYDINNLYSVVYLGLSELGIRRREENKLHH